MSLWATKHVLIKRDNKKLDIKCSKGGNPIHRHICDENYIHGSFPLGFLFYFVLFYFIISHVEDS